MFLDKVLKGEEIKPGKYDVRVLEGTMTGEKGKVRISKFQGALSQKPMSMIPSNWGNDTKCRKRKCSL